jgi:hypothetical protein
METDSRIRCEYATNCENNYGEPHCYSDSFQGCGIDILIINEGSIWFICFPMI